MLCSNDFFFMRRKTQIFIRLNKNVRLLANKHISRVVMGQNRKSTKNHIKSNIFRIENVENVFKNNVWKTVLPIE